MNQTPAAESLPSSARSPLLPWLLAVLLVLVTLAAYLPSFHSGFIQYDDPGYVTDNPHVRSGLSWNNIKWAFSTGGYAMGIWGPVTWVSHMADCQLFGLNPAGHHASNIVLHALCAVLLFLLLYKGTGYLWRSLLVASLFALHPLNVENVAWVAERKSILSLLFSLCTVGLYCWYVRAPRWSRYLSFFAAFILALLSKPMAVTLPVILLLLDYWPLQRLSLGDEGGNARTSPLRQLILEKVPLLIPAAIFSWIAIASEKSFGGFRLHVPLSQRLENAAISFVVYLRKMVWPSDLAFYYPFRENALSWSKALLAALFLVAITALVYRLRQRRHLVFGWTFFVISMLPVIGILKLLGDYAMADRYVYVPMIGLLIAVVWEIADWASKVRIPASYQAVAALLVVAAAAACTTITAGYWHSNLTLFSRAHAVTSPPNELIETNLAGALSDAGRLDDALIYYRNAESLAPNHFNTHFNVGYTLAQSGNHAAAAAEFQQALRFASSPAQKARGLNSLSIAYLNLDDKPQALSTLTQLVALQPQNAEAHARIESLKKDERTP